MVFSLKTKRFIVDFKLELVLGLIMLGMVINIIFQLAFVVPSFKNIFEGQGELPLPTRFLLWASECLQSYFILLLPVMGVAVALPGSVFWIRKLPDDRYEWCKCHYFMYQFALFVVLYASNNLIGKAVFLPMLALVN